MHGGVSLAVLEGFLRLKCCYTALVYDEYVGRIVYRLCNRILRKISTDFIPNDWINTSHGNTSASIGVLANMATS